MAIVIYSGKFPKKSFLKKSISSREISSHARNCLLEIAKRSFWETVESAFLEIVFLKVSSLEMPSLEVSSWKIHNKHLFKASLSNFVDLQLYVIVCK